MLLRSTKTCTPNVTNHQKQTKDPFSNLQYAALSRHGMHSLKSRLIYHILSSRDNYQNTSNIINPPLHVYDPLERQGPCEVFYKIKIKVVWGVTLPSTSLEEELFLLIAAFVQEQELFHTSFVQRNLGYVNVQWNAENQRALPSFAPPWRTALKSVGSPSAERYRQGGKSSAKSSSLHQE